jgi:hypothetical protein
MINVFFRKMSFQVLSQSQIMMPLFEAKLINKFSKNIKTVGNRIVEGLKEIFIKLIKTIHLFS